MSAGTGPTDRGSPLATLLAALLAAGLGLVAGVVVGGWLAFETGYWRGFKHWIETLPLLSGLELGTVLFLAAVGAGVGLPLARRSRR